jgi:hypothetical protein
MMRGYVRCGLLSASKSEGIGLRLLNEFRLAEQRSGAEPADTKPKSLTHVTV